MLTPFAAELARLRRAELAAAPGRARPPVRW